MEVLFKSSRTWKRATVLWTAVALVALFLTSSFIRTNANSTKSPQEAATRVSVTAHKTARYDCGFDPQGAEDAIANHQMNALRRAHQFTTQSASAVQPHNFDQDDIAVIEDDGSIIMPPAAFDLKKRAVMMTPEDGGYRVTASSTAYTKDLGTRIRGFLAIDGQPISADNGYHQMQLQDAPFTFYGVTYDNIYIGSNGYITFTHGDTSARQSAAELAVDAPRIAPLWADLDASSGGGIYYNRLEGRHVITWDSLPQSSYTGLSSFQASLYDDGRIVFAYRKVKAHTALIGISPGNSDQAPQAIDFANPPDSTINGPMFETFSKEKQLDMPALMRSFYSNHADQVDMAFIWADFAYDNGLGVAHSFNISNDIQGIGIKLFDRTALYGSNSRLATVVTMGNQHDWPTDPQANMAGLASAVDIVCHELGHRWLVYVQVTGDDENVLLGRDNSHWSFFMDTRTNDAGSFSSLMEGNAWREGNGNIFTTSETNMNYFSKLDQYLMGLRPASDVAPFSYLQTDAQLHDLLREKSPVTGFTVNASKQTGRIEQIIAREGPRVPDVTASPKAFRVAFILLTQAGEPASTETAQKMAAYREALVRYFSTATDHLASLDSALITK